MKQIFLLYIEITRKDTLTDCNQILHSVTQQYVPPSLRILPAKDTSHLSEKKTAEFRNVLPIDEETEYAN